MNSETGIDLRLSAYPHPGTQRGHHHDNVSPIAYLPCPGRLECWIAVVMGTRHLPAVGDLEASANHILVRHDHLEVDVMVLLPQESTSEVSFSLHQTSKPGKLWGVVLGHWLWKVGSVHCQAIGNLRTPALAHQRKQGGHQCDAFDATRDTPNPLRLPSAIIAVVVGSVNPAHVRCALTMLQDVFIGHRNLDVDVVVSLAGNVVRETSLTLNQSSKPREFSWVHISLPSGESLVCGTARDARASFSVREATPNLDGVLRIPLRDSKQKAEIGQTRRDAVILRETRALAEQISKALSTVAHDVERIEDVVVEEQQGEKAS